MTVLNANFLIDNLAGHDATKEFYETNGGGSERWVMPVPAYAEAPVGDETRPDDDVAGVCADLAWAETRAVDEHTAVLAGELAAEIGPEGPFLDGLDGLVAAVGRELDASVVSSDGDLTHEETKRVVDVEEYRKQLAVVIGSQHYGDDAIKRFATLGGEEIDTSRVTGHGALLDTPPAWTDADGKAVGFRAVTAVNGRTQIGPSSSRSLSSGAILSSASLQTTTVSKFKREITTSSRRGLRMNRSFSG